MLENIPDREEVMALLGPALYEVWAGLCAAIDAKYEMERLWNTGGKNWQYEYKYRRGGKTLCALYAREGCVGFMVIFGKAERDKFEALQDSFPAQIQTAYAKAQTFHDGKWVMFEPKSTELLDDYMQLLAIKRKPNRK